MSRDNEIQQAVEAKRVQDTKILQKVNQAHREAFNEKFPGQCEHIMRLIAERLQTGLRKDQEMPLSNCEVANLAQALKDVFTIHNQLNNTQD